MATGVPRTPKSSSPVTLGYDGKKTEEEIIASAPGEFKTIIQHDNRKQLYVAENLEVLSHLSENPEVCGKVKLIYIDPPFSTQTNFHSRDMVHAYDDVFSCQEYIEFMRERLIFLHRLLDKDGSIYVHLDAKMVFHIKLIMDEIFGIQNFRNFITRRKSNPKNYTSKQFGNVADYILFYTKSKKYIWNKQFEPRTKKQTDEYRYQDPATGRYYAKVPVHAPGIRDGATGLPWRGVPPPLGKHWQFPPAALEEMDARGEIFWSRNGNPRRKSFLDEVAAGVSVQDIWLDYYDARNQMAEISGYPTEKNINLLERIIKASSNEGDLILDCFCGSGTTLVAADMLGRDWIGVDSGLEALRTMLHRFAQGTLPMGDFVGKKTKSKIEAHKIQRFTLIAGAELSAETALITEAQTQKQLPQIVGQEPWWIEFA